MQALIDFTEEDLDLMDVEEHPARKERHEIDKNENKKMIEAVALLAKEKNISRGSLLRHRGGAAKRV